MHNFTLEDIIEYFYNDCSFQKATALRLALSEDPHIKKEYDEIVAVQQQLPEINLSPAENTVKNIVDYAQLKKQLHTT
ncbi:hypothetical protein BH09BAC2_BH09BAC2_08470 [soil metagenome]